MSLVQSISILGCGWYGVSLARYLIEHGYKVKGSTTSKAKFKELERVGIEPYQVVFDADSESFDPVFFDCQVLIISIPPKMNSGEAELYYRKIERVRHTILKNNVKRVIFISSTSVYGDHNEHVDENTLPSPDTVAGQAMLEAEKILKDQSSFSLTILRFGGLIGPGREPARFFAGKTNIPNGRAPVNILHLDDCIEITEAVIRKDAFGHVFNACSGSHPSKMEYYSRAALTSGLIVPEFIPELKNWKNVSTKHAEKILGHKFKDL